MDTAAILRMIGSGHLEEARRILDEAAAQATAPCDKASVEYLRGRLAWKEGNKGEAISCYERATILDPDSDAAVALDQAREIMDFFNRDLYNP